MLIFRAFLALIFLVIAGYTGVVIAHHGMGLFSVFFGDMAAMQWPGQFDLDFMCLLLLSGLWVAFRHRFSAVGILLGLCAFFLGSPFLSLYLLVISLRVKGDITSLLLGENRAPR